MRAAIVLISLAAFAAAAPRLTGKIHGGIPRALKSSSRVNIIVSFASTRDVLRGLNTHGMTHGERATAVRAALYTHAQNSQATALAMLNSKAFFSFEVKSFWVSNQIFVQGADARLIHALAALEEVKEIHQETTVTLDEPILGAAVRAEWNIEKIRAPEAWAVAGQGEGGVVGIIDTGARFTHEAITGSFRAGTHSWYDPFRTSEEPRDGNGHGTHVTGTIAGSVDSGVGVAPGAKWISCKGLNDLGIGTESALIACGQFMTCPHEYNEENPDCTQAPHAVSNSWGGSGGQTFFDSVIDAWHAANIIPIFAAGNSGPTCRTVGSPADSANLVIAVAATNSNDEIADFSSRGPAEPAGAHKPDISAPGEDIRSAWINNDQAYRSISGTSMATPHVAGLVTLLKSNNPDLTYQQVWDALTGSAVTDLTFGSSVCDGISESEFPNYHFGYGRIDALGAVQA